MAKKTRSRRQQRLPDGDARAGREEKAGEASGKDAVVSLPPHLMDDILCYLSPLESARVAAVCRSWAGIASRRLSDPPPHLFAFRSTATHRRGEIIAVPLGDEPAAASSRHGGARATPAHRALQLVTRKTACVGATASGRLVLTNSRRTGLFNPVTGSFRRISKVPGLSYDQYHPHSMPVVPLGGDSFFQAGSKEVGVWLAEDDGWKTKRLNKADTLRMAVLCGGSLYALDTYGFVFKFELPGLEETELEARSLRHKCHVDLTSGELDKGYLVEAGGEVLFVWPLYTTRRVRGERDLLDPEIFGSDSDDGDGEEDDDYFFDEVTTLSGFDVFRLDMEEMQWVEERQLAGDVALFVSRRSSFSVPASEKGCVSNCVYFVCDEGAGNTWGAFSLEERRMLFEYAIGEASYKERLWFYPSVREPGQEDLDRT